MKANDPARIRKQGYQRRRLRAGPRRHRPALPLVEELRHNMAVPPDRRLGLLPLPRPRRHRVLQVLRSTPARKTRTATRRPRGPLRLAWRPRGRTENRGAAFEQFVPRILEHDPEIELAAGMS